jgi:hypothetical protein
MERGIDMADCRSNASDHHFLRAMGDPHEARGNDCFYALPPITIMGLFTFDFSQLSVKNKVYHT